MHLLVLGWAVVLGLVCIILWQEQTGLAVHKNRSAASGYKQSTRIGVWGEITSNVDWCEENYAVTPFLAEFWNCLSSLSFIVVAKYGLDTMPRKSQEKSFFLILVSVCFVGLGSALFHAVLSRVSQLLDELPMAYAALCVIYVAETLTSKTVDQVQNYRLKSNLLAVFLIMLGILSTFVEIWFPSQPHLFQALFVMKIAYLVLKSRRLYYQFNLPEAKRLLEMSMMCWLTGIFVWTLEPRICNQLGWLHLHAWWHLCSCMGVYFFIVFCKYVRLSVLGHTPKVVNYSKGNFNILPIVVV